MPSGNPGGILAGSSAPMETLHMLDTPTAPVKGWKASVAGKSMDILSRQWISRRPDERFLSLDDLATHTKARAEATSTINLKARGIELLTPEIDANDTADAIRGKMNQLTVGLPDGREVAPTNWAFGQIASLAQAPAAYLRRLPATIVRDALAYSLRLNREDDVKLYVDQLEAMAATGPNYGRIFNHEVAEAVRGATSGESGDLRWKVPGMLNWRTMVYDPHHPVTPDTTTLFANDRGVFIFLVQDLAPIEIGKLPSGEPDLVFRGFYVTNSEVGAGSLKLGAMYLRAVCCNRILWGVEGFQEVTMAHTKYAPSRFIEEAAPALRSFATGSTAKLLDGIAQARAARVASDKDEAVAWLRARDIGRKRALAIYDRIIAEERDGRDDNGPVSVWEMAQGMTAQARQEPNFDTRMDLEQDARALLDKVA